MMCNNKPSTNHTLVSAEMELCTNTAWLCRDPTLLQSG